MQAADQLGLTHKSFGEGLSRHLRVSKSNDSEGSALGGGASSPPPTSDMLMELDGVVGARDGQELDAGEAFGLMRLVSADGSSRVTRSTGGSGVELVMLPYSFNRLKNLIQQQTLSANAHHANNTKLSQAAAAAEAMGFRSDMMDYYRSIPVNYLKPLRAVLRKANAMGGVQLILPEFRERDAQENSTKASNASLPVISLPPAVKSHLEHLKMEKSKVFDRASGAPVPSFAPVDEAMEIEAKDAARLSRRTRGGTPALFHSLGGAQGNFMGESGSGGAGRTNKAALSVNPFNIPRANLLVHLRRMRLALLGQEKAARVDKRFESRHDRTTHSVPIADMGKFQEVLMRRAAQGEAAPLRDPLLDSDDLLRRNRTQFGNPFRKGDKGLNLASDEIEGEAEAATGGVKRERRRRRTHSAANRRSPSQGKGGTAGSGSDDMESSPSASPSPSPSPHVSPVPSREQSPALGLEGEGGVGMEHSSSVSPGRTWTPGLGAGVWGGWDRTDYRDGDSSPASRASDVEVSLDFPPALSPVPYSFPSSLPLFHVKVSLR